MVDSVDIESQLIDLVRDRPFLYDTKHVEYKNKMTKDNGWTYIGEQLNLSADASQKLWANVRKQYTNYLTKIKKSTGVGFTPDPFFRHKDSMEFYKSNYKPHRGITVSNFTSPQTPSVVDEDEEEEEEINPAILFSSEGLDPYLTINEAKEKAGNPESIDEDSSYSFASTSTSSKSSTKSRGLKRKQADAFETEFLTLYKKSLKEENKDEFDSFGTIVAARLRDLGQKSKGIAFDAQLEILKVIKSFSEDL